MIDWKIFRNLIFPPIPPFPNSVLADYENLPDDGLTMGTLFIGRQGSGKTTSLVLHLLDNIKKYPNCFYLILDASGSSSDELLRQTAFEPKETMEALLKRYIYDDIGNPEWIIPLPEFSNEYGSTREEQVQRVSTNLKRLAPELMKGAPLLAGLGFQEIAPEIFRLLVFFHDTGIQCCNGN